MRNWSSEITKYVRERHYEVSPCRRAWKRKSFGVWLTVGKKGREKRLVQRPDDLLSLESVHDGRDSR